MWKFQDFSITQILREINFWDSQSAKSTIFTHLEAPDFDFFGFLQFLKDEIYQNNKIPSLKKRKNGRFTTSRFSKIEFTQNPSDRKILKFSHCVASDNR